jgi:hypothetical protein
MLVDHCIDQPRAGASKKGPFMFTLGQYRKKAVGYGELVKTARGPMNDVNFKHLNRASPSPVPVGNLNSNIFVVESAEQRDWQDATEPMNLARDRCILVQ